MCCRLEVLELNFCGRGMGEDVAAALTASGPLPALTSLVVSGAYRLTDAALEVILRAAPQLNKLGLAQCSRLEGDVIEKLPTLTPHLK